MSATRVYNWERNDVEPFDIGFLSREEVAKLVSEASGILGIPVPQIKFVKSDKIPCKAIPRTWTLQISDWGRQRTTILHEVAHLATLGAIMRGEDGHGPTFVATAICLYARFLKLDPADLVTKAVRFGIQVGKPVLPRKVSNFSDIEF